MEPFYQGPEVIEVRGHPVPLPSHATAVGALCLLLTLVL